MGGRRPGGDSGAARRGHVDLSLLECMTLALNTFAPLAAAFLGRPYAPTPSRTVEIPSVEPTADGFVGFCTITPKQWADFLTLIERPDWIGDPDLAFWIGRWKRRGGGVGCHPRLDHPPHHRRGHRRRRGPPHSRHPRRRRDHPHHEPHFLHRRSFTQNPAGFTEPASPIRIHEARRSFREEAGHRIRWRISSERRWLPLAGLRVIDFTAFWAGPAATQALATSAPTW